MVGKYAYVADSGAGLQILDVSDPTHCARVGGYDTDGTATAVTVVGNRAYVADWDAGLQVIDVSNPTNCARVGGYDTSGLSRGVAVAGNYAYVADGLAGLRILKISSSPSSTLPHAATAVAQITNGGLAGISVVDPGYGYTNAPLVVIEGDGTGAIATATIKDGMVEKILIDQVGTNYSAANTFVWVASPPFVPEVSIQVSKVKVRQKVVLGRKYQLEASTQMTFWTPVGAVFTATRELLEQEFDVIETGRYFRLKEVQ